LGTLAGGLLAAPRVVEAQQQPAMRRIGILMYQSRSEEFVPLFAAFQQGLQEAGYVEGQNLSTVARCSGRLYSSAHACGLTRSTEGGDDLRRRTAGREPAR